ncbi:2,3-epoxybenzoyl-CoA dihydrolase [Vulgatibacter incomptus]|uniref:Benzoyl-CoA-dihydrodiol lyase n=1 Tax=Vulgatibacter incomptus TaxID=1391653 RepID=A0A0K1PAS7_9BACT|nr:2,3-epoxybenzoyl-CoA dihydrolase [Vulgatibacter incomptus]AKU90630.1 Benzoyl-CoA-dihydrodiol lyase [Vulgatibacter incomptus]
MDPIFFETHPSRYRHWKLEILGDVARLWMDVQESGGLRPGYQLKLNSYDLGVDIELADAVQRLRFEHPEVRALVIGSLKDKIFCAGANIHMLGASSHGFKVNFCKFTNETRLYLEELADASGIGTLCAAAGTASGGGYELALACEEILLVDDGNSAVSLPEVPLLGVLPGTGGLTRVVDKRKVRRDHADFFSTTAEGVRGKRAVEWRLVDEVAPRTRFDAKVREMAGALAASSDRPADAKGIELQPLQVTRTADRIDYRYVSVAIDRGQRIATLTVRGPTEPQPEDPAGFLKVGSAAWAIAAFRELDDALLHLRFNEPEIGLLALRTEGDPQAVLAVDRTLDRHQGDWLVREIRLLQKRVLKRLDLCARTLYALVEPGSCFAGVLLEIALAADRSYMLDDPDRPVTLELSSANRGALPTSSGLSRLEVRFLGEPERLAEVLAHQGGFDAAAALEAGLVTFAPDEIDWEDEVRIALEERAAMSPDALTGMEANLRFAGPETMETKIFGRLSAWQNWIFIRPNATGEKGALSLYGKAGQRPDFDLRRT